MSPKQAPKKATAKKTTTRKASGGAAKSAAPTRNAGPAAGQCNLTVNSSTRVLSGPANAQTTVQIKDPTNSAVFTSISYDGTQIGSNVSSASFTIKPGPQAKDLTFVYSAPVPGDLVSLVDPCGTTLDTFANNPGNPSRLRKVVGS